MKKLKTSDLNRLSIDEFKQVTKNPFVILLDDIRSAHNIGSAFRTADALCIEKIYLTGFTAVPPNKEIHKTALGATDSVSWEYSESGLEVCRRLKEEGYIIVAVEQVAESVLLPEFKLLPEMKLVLVFGNEVHGVSQQIVDFADVCLEIPQFGTKHSFNVSVSIGIVLWDLLGKLKV